MRRLACSLLLVVIAACGGDGSVRLLGPDELPGDIYAPPSPTPTEAPDREVLIWFVSSDALVSTVRLVSGGEDLAEFSLRALLQGPEPDERDAGLRTVIPDGAELLGVSMDDGVAEVNLSKGFELGAEQRELLLRLGQVVYTVTGLEGVRSVRFLIDGEPVSVVDEGGTPREVVSRRDYGGLTTPPTPAAEEADEEAA